jgi:hypothetical protein
MRDYLASCKDDDGNNLFQVTARNREADASENEPVLSNLDSSDFDELWLFAADIGASLTEKDCEGISKFRQRGGGILITRDHQDLGSCICSLGEVGADAVGVIETKLESVKKELDAWRQVSVDTAFEGVEVSMIGG